MVSLADDARNSIEAFGQEMQERQSTAGGLLRSAIGKARGQALRLSLVPEMMQWCGNDGMAPPPTTISRATFDAAAHLIRNYFIPMAERVYGDAAATPQDRNAATLARWIIKNRPEEVYIRHHSGMYGCLECAPQTRSAVLPACSLMRIGCGRLRLVTATRASCLRHQSGALETGGVSQTCACLRHY